MAVHSRAPGVPISLNNANADTAAERRAVKSLQAANGVPTLAKQGFHTQGRRWLHIVVSLPDAGTSVNWKLWTWDGMAEKWCLDTRLGTAGVVSLASTDDDNPQKSIIEINGSDRVYIEFENLGGAFTEGLDLWLGTSSEG